MTISAPGSNNGLARTADANPPKHVVRKPVFGATQTSGYQAVNDFLDKLETDKAAGKITPLHNGGSLQSGGFWRNIITKGDGGVSDVVTVSWDGKEFVFYRIGDSNNPNKLAYRADHAPFSKDAISLEVSAPDPMKTLFLGMPETLNFRDAARHINISLSATNPKSKELIQRARRIFADMNREGLFSDPEAEAI